MTIQKAYSRSNPRISGGVQGKSWFCNYGQHTDLICTRQPLRLSNRHNSRLPVHTVTVNIWPSTNRQISLLSKNRLRKRQCHLSHRTKDWSMEMNLDNGLWFLESKSLFCCCSSNDMDCIWLPFLSLEYCHWWCFSLRPSLALDYTIRGARYTHVKISGFLPELWLHCLHFLISSKSVSPSSHTSFWMCLCRAYALRDPFSHSKVQVRSPNW
jgi:hypothetical protein